MEISCVSASRRSLSSAATSPIILDSAYRGILFINKDGIVKSANPAAQRILNISTEEIVNKNYRDLIPALKNIALEEKRDEKLSYTLADAKKNT